MKSTRARRRGILVGYVVLLAAVSVAVHSMLKTASEIPDANIGAGALLLLLIMLGLPWSLLPLALSTQDNLPLGWYMLGIFASAALNAVLVYRLSRRSAARESAVTP